MVVLFFAFQKPLRFMQKISGVIDHIGHNGKIDVCVNVVIPGDARVETIAQPAVIFGVNRFRFRKMLAVCRDDLSMLVK